jgi:hypothetical protein
VLFLAGDTHRGRACEWRTGPPGKVRRHYEVVASPLSLLGYPWTETRRAEFPPSGLQLGGDLGRRDPAHTFFVTSVDQFTLLKFRRMGDEVVVTARVHRTPDAVTPPTELGGNRPCVMECTLRREA